jgi:hypothetical protein
LPLLISNIGDMNFEKIEKIKGRKGYDSAAIG